MKKRSIVLVAVVVGVLLAVAVSAVAYDMTQKHQIAKGVSAGGVDIGGMSATRAKQVLHERLATPLEQPLTVMYRHRHFRISSQTAGLHTDVDAMVKHAESFDLILNTVAASHDLDAYTMLLKRDGTMVLIGVPEHPHPSPSVANLIFKRRRIAGSLIGGIPETQEMLDFCAQHNIVCDIERIPIQQIDEAYDRLRRGDVKYRFVIDMASLAA